MIDLLRPDLDACIIQDIGSLDRWLIFHGRRHFIGNNVFDKLFNNDANIMTDFSVLEIADGFALSDDTCLIRMDNDPGIFFLTGHERGIERYPIINWESFCDFQFSEILVRSVPRRVLELVPIAKGLSSAASRVRKYL